MLQWLQNINADTTVRAFFYIRYSQFKWVYCISVAFLQLATYFISYLTSVCFHLKLILIILCLNCFDLFDQSLSLITIFWNHNILYCNTYQTLRQAQWWVNLFIFVIYNFNKFIEPMLNFFNWWVISRLIYDHTISI